MKPDVIVFFDPTRQAWVMVSRPAYLEYVLNAEQYEYIKTIFLFNQKISGPLIELLNALKIKTNNKTAREIFILRKKGETEILKASWAITNDCPYHCKICIMRGIVEPEMTTTQKIKALQKLVKLGCVWLQLTGGEPTATKDFCEIYERAYNLGFLIKIQTNGFYLPLNTRLKQLIQEKPPYQVTLSMYGASARTYNNYTGISGSYAYFLASLEILRSLRINVHINIIVTKENEHEAGAMINLCKQFGFGWFISGGIDPTFSGNSSPLQHSVTCPETIQALNGPPTTTNNTEQGCNAGKHFVHITSSGQVFPCQAARIMCEGFNIFSLFIKHILKKQTKVINQQPTQCTGCTCSICNPLRLLYFQAGLKPKGCNL